MLQWEHFKNPSVVTVFLALLLLSDKNGTTEISIGGLLSVTGLTKNTVRAALARLVESGEITRSFVKGKKTTTTINKWEKYQVGQKLTHTGSKIDTPLGQKLTHTGSKIDPPHIIYNKNSKNNNKNNKQTEYAHARGFGDIWDEWFGEVQNQTIESLLMHEKASIEELMDAAESAIIDMSMNGDSENVSNADKKKSLYSLMIYKLRNNKKNGQRTSTGSDGKANTVKGFKTLNKP